MRIATLVTTVALMAAGLGPDAAAQDLDGAWFKVTASFSGRIFDKEKEKTRGFKLKTITAYGQANAAEGNPLNGPSYSMVLLGEVGGMLYVAGGASITMAEDDERFAEVDFNVFEPDEDDVIMMLGPPPGRAIEAQVFMNAAAKVKNEELKSARLTTFTSIAAGADDEVGIGLGKVRVTMSRVPEKKLPFDPGELLTLGLPSPEVLALRETLQQTLADTTGKAAATSALAPTPSDG